jgi:hypothetical protein
MSNFNFDVAAATAILKNRYTTKKIETLAFKSSLLGIMPKDPNQGGVQYVGAIRSAIGSAVSASDTVAFTTGSSSVYNQWLCPWKSAYASANVTGEAIDRSKGEANALVDAMVSEFDGAFIGLGQKLGADLFGDGGGSFGQISTGSNVATNTITLAVPSQIFNFFQGQILQVSSDDGTGGALVRTGTVNVTGVDINLGTITVSGASWAAGIAAAAPGDYIFMNGNYNGAIAGIDAWIPTQAERNAGRLTAAFNGVVRSADPVRLAGVAYQGNGAPKSESMIQLGMLVQRMNGRPDIFVTNPVDYADLERELGSRVQYITVESFENAQIAFEGINLATPYGHVKILNDIFCPQGQGYMLELDSWLIPSMGELIRVAGEGIDGLQWLRQAGADAYQMRALYRASTYCSAPGHNGTVQF